MKLLEVFIIDIKHILADLLKKLVVCFEEIFIYKWRILVIYVVEWSHIEEVSDLLLI
jgi:hypothetical protein